VKDWIEQMAKVQNPDQGRVKITLLTASTLAMLGGPFLSPALPAIRAQYGDLANVDLLARLVLTLPALFIAANAPIAGYIVDRFGRMKVLLISLILAGLAGSYGFIAPTITALLVGRALLGIAVGGIMISSTTLIADYYSGLERAKFMGLQTGLFGIAGTVLVILSGFLADLSWRVPFLIYLVALAILPFVLLILFEPRPEFRCTDDPPPVGEPGACAGEAIHKAAGSPSPSDSKTIAPTRLIAFIYVVILSVQVVSHLIPLQVPFYLMEMASSSAAQSGFALAFFSLSFALASIFLGKKLANRDHISVLLLSLVVIGVGFSLVSLAGRTPFLYLGLSSAGAGVGMLLPNLYIWLANETPAAIRGRVLGGFTTAVFLGQFLSPIIFQPLIGFTNIQTTLLIAGGLLILMVPFLFAGRRVFHSLEY
jgi:MFS family permease